MLVEQHGVDAVPGVERTKGWIDLFFIYTGLNITMSTLLVGGLLVPALGWGELLFVVVVGNGIVGVLMVLVGQIGVDHGVPSSVASRRPLGHPVGSKIASLAIIISLVGWFGVNAELGGLAMNAVMQDLFGVSSIGLMILFLGLANIVVSIIGFESIKWFSRVAVPLLLGVMIWLAWTLLSNYSLTGLIQYDPTGTIAVSTGIDWMVSAFLAGVLIACDYSRYIRSRADNWTGVMLGIVPSAVFLTCLGSLSALATGDWNPVNGIQAVGLGAPALFVIVFSTWTNNDISIYSGGLALTNIFEGLPRWKNTAILGLVGTGLALLRLTEHFTTFLESLGVIFGPLVGVLLADYFLIGARPEGAPTKRLNWIGWGAVAVGAVIAVITPDYLIASVTAMLFSAAFYWLAARTAASAV